MMAPKRSSLSFQTFIRIKFINGGFTGHANGKRQTYQTSEDQLQTKGEWRLREIAEGESGEGFSLVRPSVLPSLKAVKRRSSPTILETPVRVASAPADGRKNEERARGRFFIVFTAPSDPSQLHILRYEWRLPELPPRRFRSPSPAA